MEELSLLEANLPTAEEYEKVIQLKQSNPNGKFDVPEKFCLSIGRIPAVKVSSFVASAFGRCSKERVHRAASARGCLS